MEKEDDVVSDAKSKSSNRRKNLIESAVSSRGCSRPFVISVLQQALNFCESQNVSPDFPFKKEIVDEWLKVAKRQCESSQHHQYFGGIKFDVNDPSSYWSEPHQFFTWWKNNVERKTKFFALQNDALIGVGGSDRNHLRSSFCQNIVALATNIRNHFERNRVMHGGKSLPGPQLTVPCLNTNTNNSVQTNQPFIELYNPRYHSIMSMRDDGNEISHQYPSSARYAPPPRSTSSSHHVAIKPNKDKKSSNKRHCNDMETSTYLDSDQSANRLNIDMNGKNNSNMSTRHDGDAISHSTVSSSSTQQHFTKEDNQLYQDIQCAREVIKLLTPFLLSNANHQSNHYSTSSASNATAYMTNSGSYTTSGSNMGHNHKDEYVVEPPLRGSRGLNCAAYGQQDSYYDNGELHIQHFEPHLMNNNFSLTSYDDISTSSNMPFHHQNQKYCDDSFDWKKIEKEDKETVHDGVDCKEFDFSSEMDNTNDGEVFYPKVTSLHSPTPEMQIKGYNLLGPTSCTSGLIDVDNVTDDDMCWSAMYDTVDTPEVNSREVSARNMFDTYLSTITNVSSGCESNSSSSLLQHKNIPSFASSSEPTTVAITSSSPVNTITGPITKNKEFQDNFNQQMSDLRDKMTEYTLFCAMSQSQHQASTSSNSESNESGCSAPYVSCGDRDATAEINAKYASVCYSGEKDQKSNEIISPRMRNVSDDCNNHNDEMEISQTSIKVDPDLYTARSHMGTVNGHNTTNTSNANNSKYLDASFVPVMDVHMRDVFSIENERHFIKACVPNPVVSSASIAHNNQQQHFMVKQEHHRGVDSADKRCVSLPLFKNEVPTGEILAERVKSVSPRRTFEMYAANTDDYADLKYVRSHSSGYCSSNGRSSESTVPHFHLIENADSNTSSELSVCSFFPMNGDDLPVANKRLCVTSLDDMPLDLDTPISTNATATTCFHHDPSDPLLHVNCDVPFIPSRGSMYLSSMNSIDDFTRVNCIVPIPSYPQATATVITASTSAPQQSVISPLNNCLSPINMATMYDFAAMSVTPSAARSDNPSVSAEGEHGAL